jgi:hypothetical protein
MSPSLAAPSTPSRVSTTRAAAAAAAASPAAQPFQSPAKNKAAAITPIPFDFEAFHAHASKCNLILNTLHEAVAPKFTSVERAKFADKGASYGGITGTVSSKSIARLASTMSADPSSESEPKLATRFLLTPDSVFCDIGCGTGRPNFYFACLPIRASVGFDVDHLQADNFIPGWRKLLMRGVEFRAPLGLFQHDMLQLRSLNPATHAFSFVGYEDFTHDIARLVVQSPSVRVLTLIVLRAKEVIESGLWDPQTDTDVIQVPGMEMSGGRSYPAFAIPVTALRRKRVDAVQKQRSARQVPANGDLEDIVTKVTSNPSQALAHCAELVKPVDQGRPKRAAKKPRVMDS